MPTVSTGLRMPLPASRQSVEVVTVAADMPKVSAAHEDVGRQSPPPPRLTSAAMDASFGEAVEQSSKGSAVRSFARGGGWGVAHLLTLGRPVPSNLHGC